MLGARASNAFETRARRLNGLEGGAGGHRDGERCVTKKLNVPENMTLGPLPSKSPELNPVENIWQYMRDN